MTFGEITSAPTDQAGGAGTSLIGGTSIGAISEVKVNSNSFSAEYGSAVSGVVNITTKSGTNRFHGEAFEFFRNDKLNANDFFSNKAGLAKPGAFLSKLTVSTNSNGPGLAQKQLRQIQDDCRS